MYNDNIKKELEDIISVPTVLVCKDGEPIEYANTEGIRKIKVRKIDDISANLMMYIADKGGSVNSLEKFSSGDFSQFLSLSNVYN